MDGKLFHISLDENNFFAAVEINGVVGKRI